VWAGEDATRPFAEWHLMYHLHRAGLPVPAPLAARYRRAGRTYTGDLITERLAGVLSLTERLYAGPLGPMGWKAVGRCIRRFHDAGVCHPDLNAHNVMLGEGEAVWLIDFDGGSLRKPGLWCDANLVRLRRSLEKVTWELPRERFAEPHWHSLLAGYRVSAGRRPLRRPA
jgi:3-deoxy-D-manno-octulosonic acid kinase